MSLTSAEIKDKYPNLYGTFFIKGSTFKGRLNSVYKTRAEKPGKVTDFKASLECGDSEWPVNVTSSQLKKCAELGIVVPDAHMPVEKARKPRVANVVAREAPIAGKATKLGLTNIPGKLKKLATPNPAAKKTNKSRKGALIKVGMTKKLSREILENPAFKPTLDDIMKGYSGIYALYNDNHLYYVGLTNNLRGRINQHQKDKHTKKWNKFVIFRIKHDDKYLKDLETLLITIYHPPGNQNKGKVPVDADMNRRILSIATQTSKQMKSFEKALR